MDSNPKISVVMICYNHEKYIGEAVDSILSQSYTDFELIIVDDGSNDKTVKIIREYEDSRIFVVEQENSGPSIALNTGINKSRGQFIALMSGDDVSLPNRLNTQIEQIEVQKADMIFCLPQIIGPDSKILKDRIYPVFFQKEFGNTAELYCQLFASGNFLCAPSCFCRRTAIETVGWFKRGLIQLQDFDYWIRACKKELVIKLFKERLIQYRHLYGANLSDKRNINRSTVETLAIYRSFFEEAPIDLLQESFNEKITVDAVDDYPDIEIDKSFLLLDHSTPTVRTIGIERIILQLEDDKIYEKLRIERQFDTAKFFQLAMSGNIKDYIDVGKNFKKKIKNIQNFLSKNWRFMLTEGPRWTERQVKKRIQNYMDQGDNERAVKIAHFYKKFPPGLTIFETVQRVIKKFFSKSSTIYMPPKDKGRVYSISRMYDYSKGANCIVHEAPSEQILLKKPNILGNFAGTLYEGEAASPREYVSIIDHAVVTGGSSLVISQTGDLLSDEMVDFPTEDFGIKSPHISFRHKNNVILSYKERYDTHITEGILLSCDHDNNYFHWLVECLPKLVLIDDLKQFVDVPLLIPDGLHENLKTALDRVNINNHPIIYLDNGAAYHVDRLIFPSALSRVIDRYQGEPVFDKDIVLSHKWVSRVADLLKKDVRIKKKPWRKLYLTRKKGLRALGNQEDIEQMLSEHNFEIVELDDVSLDFQIELFSQASVVVAPSGAALTNMLFCQPGTKVIILMSNHETTNFYFWSNLGDVAKLDVNFIAGDRLFNLTNYWSVHDDYEIDPNIVLEEIMKLGL